MAELAVATTVEDVTPATAKAVATGFRAGYDRSRPAGDAELEEIERLRSTHADYDDNEDHWKFLLRSYEGGPQYVADDTLFKHQREHDEDFKDRLARAHYQNYCQPIVDFVPEFIFSQDIDREANPELNAQFTTFKNNVDRAGTTLNNFMKQVCQDARIFGMFFVQVDKLPKPEFIDKDELSVLEAQKLGLDVPYFVPVSPLEVLDWRVDFRGNYIYLKRRELLSESLTFFYRDIERYSEWTPTGRLISRVDVSDPNKPRIVDQKEDANNWGVVPFIAHFHRRSKINKDLGVSQIQDISYQNRNVFNLTSLIDEFLYRQCFNLLAMERDTTLPIAGESGEKKIGTSNVVDVPREATHMPEYITPPSDPAEFIQSERENSIREMYRQASQDITKELFSRTGDAVEKNFAKTIPVIAETADNLQQTENRLFGLWARLQSKEWTGKVAYRDDYSVTNLLDLLVQLTTIFNSIRLVSPTFVREEWKRIVREFDGKIAHDVMETIHKEINDMSDEDIKNLLVPVKQPGAAKGVPATANMMQGVEQSTAGTDERRSMMKGDRSSTKERQADRNKRTQPPKGRS